MAGLYRDLVRILEANSCYLVRKGQGQPRNLVQPGQQAACYGSALDQIAPHANDVLKQAGLAKAF